MLFKYRMAQEICVFLPLDTGEAEVSVVINLVLELLALAANAPFFEYSLCLSRVCLGKMIVFILKTGHKVPFSSYLWKVVTRHLRPAVRSVAAKNAATLFSTSLCLSRACLGI